MSKVAILSREHAHHANHSGYAHLLDYIRDKAIVIDKSNISNFPYRPMKFISSHMGPKLYDSVSLQKEIRALGLWTSKACSALHALYGDRDIYLSRFARKFINKPLGATFHKPPRILLERFDHTSWLNGIDIAIAVSRTQIDVLHYLGIERVEFIPHGVDCDFWRPTTDTRNPMSGIAVGVHMRNIRAQVEIAEIIRGSYPDFVLELVGPPSYFENWKRSRAIRILSGLSDIELRDKYSRACFQLIILDDATANNALLEGLACGLPTIVTKTGGIVDYVTPDDAFLFDESDIDGMVTQAKLLIENAGQNAMQQKIRNRALMFDWNIVAKSFLSLYDLM